MRAASPLLAVALLSAVAATEFAQALPPAGSDDLPVVVKTRATSLLGEGEFVLTGWMRIERAAPHVVDGVEVSELAVAGLHLKGASPLGAISVEERPGQGAAYVSRGELRSLAPGGAFPATSFLDLYADVGVPDSPFGPLAFHNELALHLIPTQGALQHWPPLGVTYRLAPQAGVDNDGDGAVDEDTADDDGDGFLDEDRPGPDPDAEPWDECGDDADCDGRDGEDPPAAQCPPALCDNDGDGRVDEDPACTPLLGPTGTHLKLGLCLSDLTLEIAPALPSYSVARGGPMHLHPADVFGLTPNPVSTTTLAPFLRLPCASLGLTVDGCDNGTDGDQDDLDALSFGNDLSDGGDPAPYFSVGRRAQGLPGSAVRGQTQCPPLDPGSSPEPETDVFQSALDGSNTLVLDGNGPIGSCSSAFPLGLVEAALVRENLDALDLHDSAAVDVDADGLPDRLVYFSLDAASPSLATLGRSAADVLVTSGRTAPRLYASAAELGLLPEDDVDALCLRESGDGAYGAGDALFLSLAPGSPSLVRLGAGAGDVLVPGPAVVASALALALQPGDDVDALACGAAAAVQTVGDVNCDGVANSIDAALILQYDSGLTTVLVCLGHADTNGDDRVNAVDAGLILMFEARLIQHLPKGI